jgi:hypothetical protein
LRTDRIGRFEGVATIAVSIVSIAALYAACRPWWLATPLSALESAEHLATAASVVPFLAIAVIVASRSIDHRANNTLALSWALYGANTAAVLLSGVGPRGFSTLFTVLTYITYWCAAAMFIRTAQLFPSPVRHADLDTIASRVPRLTPVTSCSGAWARRDAGARLRG